MFTVLAMRQNTKRTLILAGYQRKLREYNFTRRGTLPFNSVRRLKLEACYEFQTCLLYLAKLRKKSVKDYDIGEQK